MSETVPSILDEMRREAWVQIDPEPLYRYADRIERANIRALDQCAEERRQLEIKVEKLEAEVERLHVNGNIAVMRAALLIILDDMHKVCKVDRGAVAKICKDALAAAQTKYEEGNK